MIRLLIQICLVVIFICCLIITISSGVLLASNIRSDKKLRSQQPQPDGEPFRPSHNATDTNNIYITEWDRIQEPIVQEDYDFLGSNYTGFGSVLAFHKDTLVVGVPQYNGSVGAVYVYRRSSATSQFQWMQRLILPKSIIATAAAPWGSAPQFGASLAIEQNILLVGAPGAAGEEGRKDSGLVVVYQKTGSTWKTQQVISGARQQQQAHFGASVALFKNHTIFVGAPGANFGGGTVYVYKKNSSSTSEQWWLQTNLQGPRPMPGDSYGDSMARAKNMLVIGATGAAGGRGLVFAYEIQNVSTSQEQQQEGRDLTTSLRTQWVLKKELNVTDGTEFDNFGSSVATDGNIILVGAPSRDHHGLAQAGVAYMFSKNDNFQMTKITSKNAVTFGYFGHRVAISEDVVAITAIGETNQNGENSGVAHVYMKECQNKSDTSWTHPDILVTCQGRNLESFGKSIAVTKDGFIFIGTNSANEVKTLEQNASIYVYRVPMSEGSTCASTRFPSFTPTRTQQPTYLAPTLRPTISPQKSTEIPTASPHVSLLPSSMPTTTKTPQPTLAPLTMLPTSSPPSTMLPTALPHTPVLVTTQPPPQGAFPETIPPSSDDCQNTANQCQTLFGLVPGQLMHKVSGWSGHCTEQCAALVDVRKMFGYGCGPCN